MDLKRRENKSMIKEKTEKGENVMSTYSIYFSPTGGTKKVTNFLAEQIDTFEEIDLCRPVSEKRRPVQLWSVWSITKETAQRQFL